MRNEQNKYCKKNSTGMTEVITKSDPRRYRLDVAKHKELIALAEHGTRDIKFNCDVPQNGGRFLLTIKTKEQRIKFGKPYLF